MEDLGKAVLLERINYLEKQLSIYEMRNMSQDDKDFLVRVAFIELTDKDGYIELMNLMKYFSFKELQNEKDSFKRDMLQQMLNKPIVFHEFSEDFKEYIFKEAEKLSVKTPKVSQEDKIELKKLSEKADLFVRMLD